MFMYLWKVFYYVSDVIGVSFICEEVYLNIVFILKDKMYM